jgi:hypothetical protein
MRQRWIRPLPGDTIPPLLVAGLYWEWIVEQGQRIGRSLGRQYDEVRFESVLREPTSALARLSRHIDHPLDYDRILDVGIGSVRRPNTSFAEQEAFNPTGRWKELPEPELRALESLIGGTLGRLGYELVTTRSVASRTLRAKRELYRRLFSTKRFLKQHTPMSRALTSLAILDTQTTR